MNENIYTRATVLRSFHAAIRAGAPINTPLTLAGAALYFGPDTRSAIARLEEITVKAAAGAISVLEAILAAEVRETEPPLAMVVGGVR